MRALLSVYDKTDLVDFARGLDELGFELVASGGTAALLREEGLEVTGVEELTGFGEMLGHRVVTLHPAVHGGILARRNVPEDLAELAEHDIQPFDLVCVNLYPFEETIASPDATFVEAIEKIDVGGPAMLRAAAKSHADVIPVCRPADYPSVLRELREGGLDAETRTMLAARAFAMTAAYDAAIARWLERDAFPATLVPAFDRELELAYGENPHQRAAFYAERGVVGHLLSGVVQRHGKELSFNNLNDLSAARLLAASLDARPACVIVKHANPCGVAVADTVEEAYANALASDPVSAYGGVVVLTRPVTAALGSALAEQFIEVLLAPGYGEQALDSLTAKPTTRILEATAGTVVAQGERDYKRVLGGLLVQDRDDEDDERDAMELVCGAVDEATWGDLELAWTVVRHVTSNAIVVARDQRTIGIGAGQMSRVDAVRIAVEKALEHGHSLEGAVLASDAFFPFADGPRLALDAGVVAIIQPGGSKRDDEVMAAVEQAGGAMVFTNRRHFRH
jgi:phosphoribosylaminoimidazolecarboxamide formyltransferase/IMP cyclohydrolase